MQMSIDLDIKYVTYNTQCKTSDALIHVMDCSRFIYGIVIMSLEIKFDLNHS
jgi:hypothetical protein